MTSLHSTNGYLSQSDSKRSILGGNRFADRNLTVSNPAIESRRKRRTVSTQAPPVNPTTVNPTTRKYSTFAELLADLKVSGRLRDVEITYALAVDIIQNGHCINRKSSPTKIDNFARDLANGDWNNELIKAMNVLLLNDDYRFSDGQHRLKGIQAAHDEHGKDVSIVVDISVVHSMLGEDENTPRSLASHIDLQGMDGALIAPALQAMYRQTFQIGGSITELMRFFGREEYRALLSKGADQVRGWLEEAKAKKYKPFIKGSELCVYRTMSVRSNSGEGAEQKIDGFLRQLATGDDSNANVAALLEILESESKTRTKTQEQSMIQAVIRQSVEGFALTPIQIQRLLKKKKAARDKKKANGKVAAEKVAA
jgi:hypothetical protein